MRTGSQAFGVILLGAVVATLGCRSLPAYVPSSASSRASVSRQMVQNPQAIQASREPRFETNGAIQLASAVGELPVTTGEEEPIRATPIEELPTPIRLSLSDAVETALMQNPDLVALRYSEGVGQGAVWVAQTHPFNPSVQIQVTPSQENPAGDPGPTNHYVLFMQQLQLAHQRRYRVGAACSALNSVRWNIVQAELTQTAQTQRLYFTALYQRQLLELARANAELNSQLLSTSERQLEAGQTSGSDVAILRLDNMGARRQELLAETSYENALLDLKRQLGLSASVRIALDGRLTDWRFQPISGETLNWLEYVDTDFENASDAEVLAKRLAAGRPDVVAAFADVATARANLDLARASRVPDLMAGPYYQRGDSGTTFWGFRVQTDIPVVNTGAPLVGQRAAELNHRHAIWVQLQYRASLEAQAALTRYHHALRLLDEGDATMSEELPNELRQLEAQFKEGEVDVVRVIAARTSFLQARRALLDTYNEIAQASASLVGSSGLPTQAILQGSSMAHP